MTSSEKEPFTSGLETFTSGESQETGVSDAQRHRTRPNMCCRLPKGLHYRISEIIRAERRTVGVVMDKVVEDFLVEPDYEPRPYIPSELMEEDAISRNYSFAPSLYDALRERSMAEGRTMQILFTRAVYDYVRKSPDDPMKAQGASNADSEEAV